MKNLILLILVSVGFSLNAQTELLIGPYYTSHFGNSNTDTVTTRAVGLQSGITATMHGSNPDRVEWVTTLSIGYHSIDDEIFLDKDVSYTSVSRGINFEGSVGITEATGILQWHLVGGYYHPMDAPRTELYLGSPYVATKVAMNIPLLTEVTDGHIELNLNAYVGSYFKSPTLPRGKAPLIGGGTVGILYNFWPESEEEQLPEIYLEWKNKKNE